MYDEDPFFQRAEFLIARGYGGLQPGANVEKLAAKLKAAHQRNLEKEQPENINSRESVYGEAAPIIDQMMENKAPVEKRLLRPYETALSKKEMDSL